MNGYKIIAATTFSVLSLALTAIPAAATPIPGIDAPLASSGVQKGYGSSARTNFGSGKTETKRRPQVGHK